jgi:hypothetical protein
MKKILLLLLLAAAALSGGCLCLLEDAALAPYDKAVRQGRMAPSEYQRMRDEVDRYTWGTPPPPAKFPR